MGKSPVTQYASIVIYIYINAGFSSHVRWHQRVAAILEPEIHLSSFNQKITRNISEPKVFQPKKNTLKSLEIYPIYANISSSVQQPCRQQSRRGRFAEAGQHRKAQDLKPHENWSCSWENHGKTLGTSPNFRGKNGAGTMGTLGKFCQLTGVHGKIVGRPIKNCLFWKLIEMGDLAASHVRLPEGKWSMVVCFLDVTTFWLVHMVHLLVFVCEDISMFW